MKIIVVGGNGVMGSAVVKELSLRHEVVVAGRKNAPLICDITSEESIRAMYKKAGKFDAVACTVGHVHFEEFSKMTAEKYRIGIEDKLMGQVNIVRIGTEFIQEGGSFTLVSGTLSHDPIRGGTSASMVDGAVEAFVRAAAIELPRHIRINCICPTILTESVEAYAPLFQGFDPIPASKAALAFSKSIEGNQTGQIYTVVY